MEILGLNLIFAKYPFAQFIHIGEELFKTLA